MIVLSSDHAPFASHLFLIFHSGKITDSAAVNTLRCTTFCLDVKMVWVIFLEMELVSQLLCTFYIIIDTAKSSSKTAFGSLSPGKGQASCC